MSTLSSSLIKLGVLTGDCDAFLLAAAAKRINKFNKSTFFCFDEIEVSRFKLDFRFEKADILRLKSELRVPDVLKMPNRTEFSGLICLCVMLRRLAYPNRLSDLEKYFGFSPQDLSYIFNSMINHVYGNFYHLLTSLQLWWLSLEHLKEFSGALVRKGCPIPSCIGFIDGTLHKTCRPTRSQQEVYSGHKRSHGLKYQSVVTPNGMVANLYGPIPGRRHDSYMLHESGLLDKLAVHLGGQEMYLYGDSGYPLHRSLITPHIGNQLSDQQKLFNLTMSKLRVCVEWEFVVGRWERKIRHMVVSVVKGQYDTSSYFGAKGTYAT
ncbi:putative nuclease HARBI1 [Folsomia candida]|uniref:Putative nuclease HARBI1 n=1 Tax=Folsomia candida TaxID=158441 RepID=A0A226DQQ7_FOLCA|nr:putative nuclease HARBI1 [Folsomia candida]